MRLPSNSSEFDPAIPSVPCGLMPRLHFICCVCVNLIVLFFPPVAGIIRPLSDLLGMKSQYVAISRVRSGLSGLDVGRA